MKLVHLGNKARQGWEGIRNYVKTGQLKENRKCKRKRFESDRKKTGNDDDDDLDESEDEGEAELEKVKEGAIKEMLERKSSTMSMTTKLLIATAAAVE